MSWKFLCGGCHTVTAVIFGGCEGGGEGGGGGGIKLFQKASNTLAHVF